MRKTFFLTAGGLQKTRNSRALTIYRMQAKTQTNFSAHAGFPKPGMGQAC